MRVSKAFTAAARAGVSAAVEPVAATHGTGGREPPSPRGSAAIGQPDEAALDALQRATVGEGDEQRVVAGDRTRDLGPPHAIERGGDRVSGPGKGPQHEQETRIVDLEREVGQELAQAVLARRLGLDQARGKRVRSECPRASP